MNTSWSGADIDPTGAYRWRLWRRWAGTTGSLGVVMLNPSTADAYRDDPTIRRVIRYAQAWGFPGIEVCNLYAYRASNPAALKGVPNPVGADNGAALDALAATCSTILCAWGTGHGAPDFAHVADLTMTRLNGRALTVCLGTTRNGQPVHPLYQPARAIAIRYPQGATA